MYASGTDEVSGGASNTPARSRGAGFAKRKMSATHINAAPALEAFFAVPPNWMSEGACGGDNAQTMEDAYKYRDYTSAPATRVIDKAKAVCAECPVRELCLQFELAQEQPVGDEGVLAAASRYGVWGGATPQERYDMAVEALG